MDLGDASQWNEGYMGWVRLDLLAHFLLFTPWAWFAEKYWASAFSPGVFSSFSILMAIGLFLSIGLEAMQYLLSYRIFAWEDMGCNVVGLLSGYGIRRAWQ